MGLLERGSGDDDGELVFRVIVEEVVVESRFGFRIGDFGLR